MSPLQNSADFGTQIYLDILAVAEQQGAFSAYMVLAS